jgi:hypothetical protein
LLLEGQPVTFCAKAISLVSIRKAIMRAACEQMDSRKQVSDQHMYLTLPTSGEIATEARNDKPAPLYEVGTS